MELTSSQDIFKECLDLMQFAAKSKNLDIKLDIKSEFPD